MRNRTPLIHIGMPKTATKTLQWRLFSRHSEVYYLGRFDGPQFQRKHRRIGCCRNARIYQVMDQIAYGNIFEPDFARCDQLIKNELEHAADNHLVPVWSWESYSTDILSKRRVRARNLSRLFGKANILMVLRNPLALLESAYFQHLKRENVSSKIGWFSPPYYQSMDQWLEEHFEGEILPHIQYGQSVEAFASFFGLENVHVLLFEDLVADESAFFRRVCGLMQIDAEEGLKLATGERDNERWTTFQVETMKDIVASPLRSYLFKIRPRSNRLRMLKLDDYGIPIASGQKARALISPRWQEEIFKAAEEGNQWLEKNLGLPLTKYGYRGKI